MSIPDLFKCPISLDLFTDPVTLSTGQTYDRPFIETWFAHGNLTCPVTMQRLETTSFVPNNTLKHLITQWKTSDHPRNFSLSTLKHCLESNGTHVQSKIDALQQVRALSNESDNVQVCMIQLGFLQLLFRILFQSPSVDQCVLGLTVECITSILPRANLDTVCVLMCRSSLDRLIFLLEEGDSNVQNGLCILIESIASCYEQPYRLLLVLVSLLYQGLDTAVRAVSALCTLETNLENVVKAGGIDGLVFYLSISSSAYNVCALSTLEVLLKLDAGKKYARKSRSVIDVLVRNVFRTLSDNEGSGYAIGSLVAVCENSGWAQAEAVRCGVVMQLLLLIQSQCGVEVKMKARDLLKMFRFMWVEDE